MRWPTCWPPPSDSPARRGKPSWAWPNAPFSHRKSNPHLGLREKRLMPSRSVLNLHRHLLKAVLAVVVHPRLTLLISGVVMLGCVGLAFLHLNIDTDQDKLFSSHVGFFKDYLDYINRF